MLNLIKFRILFILLLNSSSALATSLDTNQLTSVEKCSHILTLYPDAIESFDVQSNTLVFKNGHRSFCDDGQVYNLIQNLDYQKQMSQVDLSDILLQAYPDHYMAPITEKNYSPGRFRHDQLLINTYLNINALSKTDLLKSAKDDLTIDDVKILARYLQMEIVKVKFLGFDINMNQRNGAAEALARVGRRLEKDFPQGAKWLISNRNMSGGFNMRFISGTKRLSSHSWGIAVDFTLKNATPNLKWFDSYWKWIAVCAPNLKCSPARTDEGAKYRRDLSEELLDVQIYPLNFDHFPPEIVQVFADEGYIWGGHWHHFDTMHFEYRPEFFTHQK